MALPVSTFRCGRGILLWLGSRMDSDIDKSRWTTEMLSLRYELVFGVDVDVGR